MVAASGEPPILATQATAATDDTPDPTGQAVTAGDRFTINGVSADVPPDGYVYHDRDAFSLYTGATTNQLDIRTTWTDGIADMPRPRWLSPAVAPSRSFVWTSRNISGQSRSTAAR